VKRLAPGVSGAVDPETPAARAAARIVQRKRAAAPATNGAAHEQASNGAETPEPAVVRRGRRPRVPAPPVTSAAGSGIRIDIHIDVPMAALESWKRDRLEAFFDGIAAVLEAKGGAHAEP
jgi:hypothetical protein